MILLPLSFFITALLYASVGFGGGSTYNALLVIADTDYRILPTIALLCNLIVVSGGVYRFSRESHINCKRILPWVITSVPAALIGGYIQISEFFFIGLLGFSLLIAGLRMFWPEDKGQAPFDQTNSRFKFVPFVIGGLLGLLAGLVGIGGGIFLAPILHLLRWDTTKSIAGTCSVFILVNSLSGLIGQLMKLSSMELASSMNIYWFVFPAVLIGGQIGSKLGASHLEPSVIRFMTAVLILYVSIRLISRWWLMI